MGAADRTRTCIFCGKVRRMTKEHVLRRKFKKLLGLQPGLYSDRHTFGATQSEPDRQSYNEYAGVAFNKEVKRVCAPCNNGWMASLEDAVEPVLLSIVRGEHLSLDRQQVSDLTRWIAKTVFVAEQLDRGEAVATRKQRQDVMNGVNPDRFHAYIFPLDVNEGLRIRSTPISWTAADSVLYPSAVRFTTIHIHRVHFFAVTCRDSAAEVAQRNAFFSQNMLEMPTWKMTDGLDWPGERDLAPEMSVQLTHDLISGAMLNYRFV